MLRYINFFCSLFIRKAVKNNYGRFSYAFSICFIIYAADDGDGGGVADVVWHCHSLIWQLWQSWEFTERNVTHHDEWCEKEWNLSDTWHLWNWKLEFRILGWARPASFSCISFPSSHLELVIFIESRGFQHNRKSQNYCKPISPGIHPTTTTENNSELRFHDKPLKWFNNHWCASLTCVCMEWWSLATTVKLSWTRNIIVRLRLPRLNIIIICVYFDLFFFSFFFFSFHR